MRDNTAATELLTWYDKHARDMPWRISPKDRKAGIRPDPYRVWLSEVMLQQTTVAAVRSYFETFTKLWPRVQDLAAASDPEVMAAWAGLGYYARARNLLKCARVVSHEMNGVFPDNRVDLQALPGIGPYTSAAISAIAYDLPETVVDGNVERVMSRVHAVETPLPKAKSELTALAENYTPKTRAGDYAQAVMDLGATICTPRKPTCSLCPWQDICAAFRHGTPEAFPKKEPKKAKPVRRGVAYVAKRNDGAWLLERRPAKGLLGGMLGWPGSNWSDAPDPNPPFDANWTPSDVEVRHTFTHFHLVLSVQTAQTDGSANPETGEFLPASAFRPTDLPTVMRKVFDVARDSLESD